MKTTTYSKLEGQFSYALEMYEKEDFAACRQKLNEIFALNLIKQIEKTLKDGTDEKSLGDCYQRITDMLQTLKLNLCDDGTPCKIFHKRVLALLLELRNPDFKTSFQKIFQQEFFEDYLEEIDNSGGIFASANIIAEKINMNVLEFVMKCSQIPGLEFKIVCKPSQKD